MSKSFFIRLLDYLMYIPVLLILTGCTDDLRNRSVFDCGAGEAVIRFSIDDVILTRDGESVDKESEIDHAYLLFYSSDASLITDAPIAAVKAELDPAQSGGLRFKMPLILKPNTNYQLMAIANADFYTPSEFNNFGDYLESWCRTTPIDRKPLHLFSSSRIGSDVCLPMYGGVAGNSTFRFSMANGEYSVPASISFRRMVARIDVANIVKEGFKVEGVALCNWRDAVPIATYDSQLGNDFGSLQDVLSNETETISASNFIDMPEAEGEGIQSLSKSIYCFPSVANDAYLGDKVSTALIVKAKYGNDSESTYYRINIGPTDSGTKINANTKYLVTIQSVKGSGAATPQEAYFASESQIVLSVVEGWDLEGDAYAMDDYGNFMVLSKGRLEFAGNDTESQVVKVLTSKGLQWGVEYVGENDAFLVDAVSNAEIVISPKGVNEGDAPLTGRCRVYANTTQGTTLEVLISLQQLVAEEEDTALPDDMPFGLIPSKSYKDRVKIDHANRTIEIDGFDPDCFNSFIDIPFEVSIQDPDISDLNITTTLEWPLEGRISIEKSSGYFYGIDSFVNNVVYSKNDQNGFDEKSLENSTLLIHQKGSFYISVGAMGPDDPAIPRSIKLISGETEISYSLTIKPRPAIIDDVIIQDGANYWLIMDRNVQETNKYARRKDDGSKYQAYNYCEEESIKIPFKLEDYGVGFSEKFHSLYRGDWCYNYNIGDWRSKRNTWLTRYKDSRPESPEPNFYGENNYNLWIYPGFELLQFCCDKMRMSKMRMFLLSDIPAFKEGVEIPICCYFPYVYWQSDLQENSDERCGYLITNGNSQDVPSSIIYIVRNIDEIKAYEWKNETDDRGFSRLVRSVSSDELEAYKLNFLGYGSEPLRLTLCHPDTYDSPGWIGS